ncbi:hypothetical protein DFR70_103684 [Nocardia tenerifensis]|uniref:Uncharacterized protein n=1 Tax=Nocardia tenerifensis TaxID=228006 RepID=A0A318K5K9_9NOCA|nr:hypothetical protein [Nocardia tenerifensis]PXX66929.1 hypothetical protein DFR70_103684 [Nocardia tenerifensis]
MSDRSPEDELIAEAVAFGRAFKHMLHAHAQAATWLERRRIRKQISQKLREQRRAEQGAREHQLSWTQQMVDRYRTHAAIVAERAENPNVYHTRRYEDSRALAEHADYLREKIIDNSRLTLTERGIALDGLDAATVFPHLETGRLFDRAHKVKGIDALRYRARVAQEKTGRAQRVREVPRDQGQTADLPRVNEPERFATRLTWSDPQGWVWSELGSARTEAAAADWVHDNLARANWMPDTTVELNITDTHDQTAPIYRDYGEPRAVAGNLAAYTGAQQRTLRRDAAAEAAHGRRWTSVVRYHAPGDLDADRISVLRGYHDDREDSARWVHDTVKSLNIAPRTRVSATLWDTGAVQPTHVAAGSPSEVIEDIRERWYRYGAQISYVPEGADQAVHETRGHVSEAECVDWTRRQLDAIRPAPGTHVQIGVYDSDRSDHDPVLRTEGPIGMVADELDALREQHPPQTRPQQAHSAEPPDAGADDSRLAQVERQLTDIAADRDRLGSRVEILQRGLDAVTADRDEIRRKLGNAESQIESLKNRNQRLATEIGELQDRPSMDAVAAERDRYKRERDEAVTKLAARMPREQRYGSKERVEFDELGNTQRWSREASDAGDRDGLTEAARAAREAFDEAIVEQMSADFVKAHGDIYDEPKMRQFAREWLTNASEQHEPPGIARDVSERNGQRRNGIERGR